MAIYPYQQKQERRKRLTNATINQAKNLFKRIFRQVSRVKDIPTAASEAKNRALDFVARRDPGYGGAVVARAAASMFEEVTKNKIIDMANLAERRGAKSIFNIEDFLADQISQSLFRAQRSVTGNRIPRGSGPSRAFGSGGMRSGRGQVSVNRRYSDAKSLAELHELRVPGQLKMSSRAEAAMKASKAKEDLWSTLQQMALISQNKGNK